MVGEKSRSINGLSVYHTCLLSTLGIIRGLLWLPLGLPQCWPKMNRLPVIFPAKMGLFGSTKTCNLESANMVSYFQVLLHKKERSTLLKREIGSGGAVTNKEYIGGIESLKYSGLSLPELGLSPIDWSLNRQRKESVYFPVGLCCHHGAREFHLLSFRIYSPPPQRGNFTLL